MERYTYTLANKYSEQDQPITAFANDIFSHLTLPLVMGLDLDESIFDVITFVAGAVYGYFYGDSIAYEINEPEDFNAFLNRFSYDVSVKLPYWNKKYKEIKKLLTTEQLSVLQTSKVTSSSSENTDTASGSLQKTATTPTGVSTGTSEDSFEIEIDANETTSTNDITTTGFADKYTNAQQKFANSGKAKSNRSGEILREGSIEEMLKVLESLPSSFANEITKALQKHFIFDYDGQMKGIY